MRIVVTGGTGALGSRIAHLLREAGASTVVAARNTPTLAAAMGLSEALAVDLSIPGAGKALVSAAAAGGPIDGIVVAHGVVAFGNIAELDDSTTAQLTAINQSSVIDIVASAVPALRVSKASGREPFIVTISGVISEGPVAGMAAYGATKAAVRSFVGAAQRELRREGIRILDVRPPHTETGLATRAISGVAPSFPAGANPDDVANRIVGAILNAETDVPSNSF